MKDDKPDSCRGTAGKICAACEIKVPLRYWCGTCEKAVAEKRCPFCGLKARRIN